MKNMKTMIGAILFAIASVFRFGARETQWNGEGLAGTHDTGRLTMNAEAAFTVRYLLAQKGTAADGIIVNVANTRPWGVVQDEPANGDAAAVALLGCTPGTLKVVASKAIAAGAKCWTAAAGKVTDTHSTGAFFVGRAITAAAGDLSVFELAHTFPVLDASGTAL